MFSYDSAFLFFPQTYGFYDGIIILRIWRNNAMIQILLDPDGIMAYSIFPWEILSIYCRISFVAQCFYGLFDSDPAFAMLGDTEESASLFCTWDRYGSQDLILMDHLIIELYLDMLQWTVVRFCMCLFYAQIIDALEIQLYGLIIRGIGYHFPFRIDDLGIMEVYAFRKYIDVRLFDLISFLQIMILLL